MLLAFGNLFSTRMTFCCEGLFFLQTDILSDLSIKVVSTNYITEILSGTLSKPSLQLTPWLLNTGIAKLVRELRSPHAFLNHMFSF